MIVLLLTFFLRPGSGERIAVVMTVLLSLCFFLQFINNITPNNSDTTPMLSRYYITVLVESALLLIATLIVFVVDQRGEQPCSTPVPQWLRNSGQKAKKDPIVAGDSLDQKDTEQMLPSRKRYSSNTSFNGAKLVEFKPSLQMSKEDVIGDNGVLYGILDELKVVSSEVQCRQEVEDNELEWKCLSRYLDWFFFLVFFCLFFLTSLLFLVPAYLQHVRYIK
jgi:hypothetical protein